MTSSITSEQQLRQVIPAYPKIMDKRIQSKLDHYCHELIEHSTLAIFACSDTSIPMQVIATRRIHTLNEHCIDLSSLSAKTHLDDADTKCFASLYVLVPGVGHGLRINGSLERLASGLKLHIQTVYVHCARAAARSKLWETPPKETEANQAPHAFLEQCSYLMLKTMNQQGQTELSPRGDQFGFVKLINSHSLFIPERPGNKVAISLRNILQNETIELLAFQPSSNYCLRVTGNATLSQNESLLAQSIVGNKRPKLGIRIDDCQYFTSEADDLINLGIWDSSTHIKASQLSSFTKVLSSHMNGEGMLGKVARPVIQGVVNHDMKNLY